ncbi:hypothetical protein CPSG_00391 [Coccidioides posadasii str. Silveira]|uniref:Uncharacterized protein n=1 Tax=Coccidioides posadasii (strain RMSCC 757 / Silveira) TaxID=443226 RepID=E9CRW9_COCPS|nr:hypothetical protein CPSG_00391 [Coccidioides posadasii str. Silveira]
MVYVTKQKNRVLLDMQFAEERPCNKIKKRVAQYHFMAGEMPAALHPLYRLICCVLCPAVNELHKSSVREQAVDRCAEFQNKPVIKVRIIKSLPKKGEKSNLRDLTGDGQWQLSCELRMALSPGITLKVGHNS